ncbi:MAG: hypothetical protein K2K64_07970 [Muribaculaceae bacterium]|nr:hypothetical protein [Muribaculaceae bacterium]
MKKSINLLLMLVMMVVMAGCGGRNDRVLKAQIESGQKHCPMSLGMAGKLTKMSYDEETGEVCFTVQLNKQVQKVKDLEAAPEATRQGVKLAMQKGSMKQLLEMMVDADASLKVVYKNKGSEDEFVVAFTNAELKDMLDHPMTEEETNRLMLDNQIRMENSKIPYRIDKGLNVTNIEDNGTSLVYTCEVDENLYELDDMGNAKDELKNDMKKMMKDKAMRQQAEILASLNKGFEYHYVGKTSGKKVIVAFSGAELAEIAKKK